MAAIIPEMPDAVRMNGHALPPMAVVFGNTAEMLAIRERVKRLASANVPVLIQGESGTGKDIIARVIHALSATGEQSPFLKVNCPAIPGSRLGSELFGCERAAGINGHEPGRDDLANGGTLYLDEIAELAASLQSKLLHLLQDGQFSGADDDRAEIRLVCASNRPLDREVEKGAFRQDLYYRINVVCIQVPALRQRKDDIPVLANYFLDVYSKKYDRPAAPLSRDLLARLRNYSWPGNIRELENLIKRYVILGSEDALTAEFTASSSESTAAPAAVNGNISLKALTRNAVRELETKIIIDALEANRWNRRRTARTLNISYRALLYKLKQANALKNTPAANDETGPQGHED
ncbi:MAG TPA: sigma-54 dependent transcriptional regulator [Terriglobales bacterium]|nr:sigma-54 dependent transcriptional regulator [Terriglobales bacterium]